jgi:hypothetical protein
MGEFCAMPGSAIDQFNTAVAWLDEAINELRHRTRAVAEVSADDADLRRCRDMLTRSRNDVDELADILAWRLYHLDQSRITPEQVRQREEANRSRARAIRSARLERLVSSGRRRCNGLTKYGECLLPPLYGLPTCHVHTASTSRDSYTFARYLAAMAVPDDDATRMADCRPDGAEVKRLRDLLVPIEAGQAALEAARTDRKASV